MISFNIPTFVGTEHHYLKEVVGLNKKTCGDGPYVKKCSSWFEVNFHIPKVLLTMSCTHALEMAAILMGINHDDEVIMSSYTFSSTANAFVLRGAKIVFVDIRPDTMNIDENLIEDAITEKTKAIVPVHYAGIACNMDKIMETARRNKLLVIEDAAQGVMSKYNGKALGSIGDIGCYSFHETKNYSMGEGGAILINNDRYADRSEIISEKGTDRSRFIRGEIDKYTWVDIGSSYLPSELNAAYLYAQLIDADKIDRNRLSIWNLYFELLRQLSDEDIIQMPTVPHECRHNAHMFYIKAKDFEERNSLICYLQKNGISSVFHYIPLHTSPAGKQFSRFHGVDIYTTKESERLLRLPIYYNLEKENVEYIVQKIYEFYGKKLLY